MGPYNIHFRTKTLLYLFFISFILYVWYYVLSSDNIQINPYRSSYVNFKKLLIACIIAAQRGGTEVVKARVSNLNIKVKGKTKEGVIDVLTQGDRMSNMAMVNSMLDTFPGIKIISEEHLPTSNEINPIVINRSLFNNDAFSTIPDDINLNIDDLVIWIDPLDATKEYSEGLTQYVTTMVCVARYGEPLIGVIHQPFVSKTYWATKFGIDKQLLSLRHSFMSPNNPVRLTISRSHKGNVEQMAQNALGNVSIIEAAGSGFKTIQLIKGNADIYLHKTYIKKWDICAPNAILKFATEGTLTTINGDSIRYDFESDFVNKDGVFATAKSDLVTIRDKFAHY
ncbi:Inositol monophosphatase 3 [Blomia tropicalis]|nr:Inositol monophosphatase 3 [Blomia tropicalis]